MIRKIKQVASQNRDLIRFLGSAFLLLLMWVLITTFLPGFVTDMHYLIIKPQADISATLLRFLGFEISQTYQVNNCEASIIFVEHGTICIGSGCSGLELFILFFGFILLMRGRLKDKAWFIPAGFLGILILNIIRIVALSAIYYYNPEYLEFNHKYTFVVVVYGAIFGLWVLWVNKFANRQPES